MISLIETSSASSRCVVCLFVVRVPFVLVVLVLWSNLGQKSTTNMKMIPKQMRPVKLRLYVTTKVSVADTSMIHNALW